MAMEFNKEEMNMTEQEHRVISSGVCGKDLKCSHYNEGTLVISGTGMMFDYNNRDSKTPFYNNVDIKK